MTHNDPSLSYLVGKSQLIGRTVRLEPLTRNRLEDLRKSAKKTDSRWFSHNIEEDKGFDQYFEIAMENLENHLEIPFIVIYMPTNQVIGSTRYMDIRWEHKGLEIGNTWYEKAYWETAVNPECKYLLLKNAFEEWQAIRVQIKADTTNQRSIAAITKLGARFEGILRNQKIRRDGSIRDTAMFSVTKEDWPDLKPRLEARIKALETRASMTTFPGT
ncbi:MAG: GNAT family protein [Thermoplasmataceae archaeon]|jgi:RimJ/RimL family protein N-acetyltransferase